MIKNKKEAETGWMDGIQPRPHSMPFFFPFFIISTVPVAFMKENK